MARNQFMDWGSRDSHLILNPKMPELKKHGLHISDLPAIPAHIWISSSGSRSLGIVLYALSKTSFLISAVAVNTHLLAKKSDIWLNVLPIFHVGGLAIFARAYLSNSEVVDRSLDRWSADKFFVWANDSKATLTALVPTQLFDLVQTKRRAPLTLRAIVIGGAHLEDELYFAARALGYNILPSYGMTECCSQIATAGLDSLGANERGPLKILSHVEAKTVDGRLAIKSPALFTARAEWRTDLSQPLLETLWRAGDWYFTADLARVDGVTITPLGRSDDQVKISGELVNLRHLEVLFKKISQQKVATLFAQPDNRRGAEVALALSQDDYVRTKDWIEEFNKQVLPVAKIRAVYFVRDLPISDLGKVKISTLRRDLGLFI